MTPPSPSAPGQGPADAGAAVSSCAVPEPLVRMKLRRDFLQAARAARQGTPGFMLQARRRGAAPGDPEAGTPVRVGFTCSKKVGNSVARNRAKRRLREAARLVLPDAGRQGWDYVLIGRAESTAARDFEKMQADLRWALGRVHAAPPPPAETPGTPPPA